MPKQKPRKKSTQPAWVVVPQDEDDLATAICEILAGQRSPAKMQDQVAIRVDVERLRSALLPVDPLGARR